MRSRSTLFVRLLGAALVPTLLLFGGFAWIGRDLAERTLERELGQRLTAIATLTGAQLDVDLLANLQPGDEETRTYRNLAARIEAARATTGAARIYVVDASLATVIDTKPDRAIGAHDYRLDAERTELRAALAGKPTASLLFRGQDGVLYKSGFSPIGPTPARFLVGADGAASFYDQLADVRRAFSVAALAAMALVVGLSFFVARRISRGLARVSDAAARIGQGDLETPVTAEGQDEVGVVAETLEAMRRQILERDARMQMMLAGIAHEIRNPLAGMALYAGILRDELSGESLEHVRKIERELGHLKDIVTSFLEYARRARPELLPTDLVALAHEIRDLQTGSVTVEATGAPRVAADATQLRRALLNLVQNAVHALEQSDGQTDGERPPIVIAIAPGKQTVAIEIRDRGPGIPAEALDKIWTPFYTTKQQGTGLGLAFVKEIVTDHGGTITVESRPGHGTTFRIELPLLDGTKQND